MTSRERAINTLKFKKVDRPAVQYYYSPVGYYEHGERLNELYAKHCGRTYEEVEKTRDRDYFMTAEEAKEWGLVDHVYETRDATDGGAGDKA
jgi:hypothetical protein